MIMYAMAGREEGLLLLKLPVSTPTHDFPGCPVAFFNLMVDVTRVFVGGQILSSRSFLALVWIHWLLKYF